MSAQSDLIDFFQLNATFDPTTRSTSEVVRSSDRTQLKRQIITVKKWKRQPEPIGMGGSGIIWLEHDEDGKERVVKQILKATTTTPLRTNYKRELQALGRLSKVSSKNSYQCFSKFDHCPAPGSFCTLLWMV